ncbi:MAG: hypothetical protein M1820_001458 [Bogoriella megaspora]|nr:MAG: hypothetical protein M1820_001458 [Bogoriella megaspora]
MLSLTECHLGTVGVGAAFVNNPIVDWVSMNDTDADSLALDEDAAKSLPNNDPADTRQDRRRRRPFQAPSLSRFAFKPQLPTRGLLSARDQLFSTTSYFDPFASPSLFFRTSGVAPPSIYDIDNSDIEQGATRTPRKAYLKYPPSTSALRLPTFRVETGEQSPLKDQNEEFVNLLKRSHRTSADAVMKQQPEWEGVINDDSPSESGSDLEEGNGNKPAYPEKPSAITSTNSTARAQLVFDDGVGLWADLSPDQKMEKLIEIDLWFKANLP